MNDTHRWPRATTQDDAWGRLCACGNLKTDQALTCAHCAAERRRAPDYWEQRTCACGGPKTVRRQRCRTCANELARGVDRGSGRPQPDDHQWRKDTTARILASSRPEA